MGMRMGMGMGMGMGMEMVTAKRDFCCGLRLLSNRRRSLVMVPITMTRRYCEYNVMRPNATIRRAPSAHPIEATTLG